MAHEIVSLNFEVSFKPEVCSLLPAQYVFWEKMANFASSVMIKCPFFSSKHQVPFLLIQAVFAL